MEITQQIREYAQNQELQSIEQGLKQKAQEFLDSGSEIYIAIP
jgi:hypothetical protein